VLCLEVRSCGVAFTLEHAKIVGWLIYGGVATGRPDKIYGPAIKSNYHGQGVALAREAYLDGELCGVRSDGTTSFSLIQKASDTGTSDALVFFLFDLLHLDGEAIAPMPVAERKERLRALLSGAGSPCISATTRPGAGGISTT